MNPRKPGALECAQITGCFDEIRLPCGCRTVLYQTRAGMILRMDIEADACGGRGHLMDSAVGEEAIANGLLAAGPRNRWRES